MTIKEIMQKIDTKKINSSNTIECDFMDEFQIDGYKSIFKDGFKSKLKDFYFSMWYCSDTCVGERIIFFDEKPLCVGIQDGRKSDEYFYFFSENIFKEFYKYMKSLEENDGLPEFELLDKNEDLKNDYQIPFCSNLMSCHKEVNYNGEVCKITNKKPNDNYLCEEIQIKYKGENITVQLNDVTFPYMSTNK